MITPTAASPKVSADSIISHAPRNEISTSNNINSKVNISSKDKESKVVIKDIKTNKNSSKLSELKESTKTSNVQELTLDLPMNGTRPRTNRGVNPKYLP